MRILKFGGKSLENLQKTQNVCKFIKKTYKNDKKLIIVVSAMGNTTNDLLNLAKQFNPKNKASRELDCLLSSGETISASLVAIILNSMSVPAQSLLGWQVKINTHGDFQNSLITSIDKSKIENCLNSNTVAVIAGFQGINKNGDITTLGRGGSDTTAAALGAVFSTNVELYSDFNGMFACDPRTIKTKKLNAVSLNQLESAANDGMKLVCNRAVKLAKENNISLKLKSSTSPQSKGTLANSLEKENVLILTKSNLCEISINCSAETKLKFIAKNVIFWLNNYKIYNLGLENQNIKLTINEADKQEILQILIKKLKL